MEAILTIIIIGFCAGFIFSIPVAGPINVIITSNALSGKLRYCIRTALGSSIIEFLYIVIIVYGISSLYSLYKPFIPYLLIAGSIILFIVGIRVTRVKLKLKNIDDRNIITDKMRNKGGFRTGIFVNLTNPSLFLGWLTSTFIIFSFVSSLGINTGGLNIIIDKNVNSLKRIEANETPKQNNFSVKSENNEAINGQKNPLNPLLLGISYGLPLAVGSFFWLYIYSHLLVRYRKKLRVSLLNKIIHLLGFLLLIFSIYLIYQAALILFF